MLDSVFKKLLIGGLLIAISVPVSAGYYSKGLYHPFIWGECENIAWYRSAKSLIYAAVCEQHHYCNSDSFLSFKDYRVNDAWLEFKDGVCTAKAKVKVMDTGAVITINGLVLE